MKIVKLLSAILLLTLASCIKDHDNDPEPPPTPDDYLTKHTWMAQAIDVTFSNSTTGHYERGGSVNTINYDSDSIKFSPNGTGTYYYQGNSYTTTWTWTNAGKTALTIVIAYSTPITVDLSNIHVSDTEFTYTQVQGTLYTATGRRIPNNGTTSPPTLPTKEQLLIANTWMAQEIDIVYASTATDHYVRGGTTNTVDYDSDSLKFELNGTGTYYYQGAAYATTWTWTNPGKTSLSIHIAYSTPITIELSNIVLSTSEFTYTQVQGSLYSATGKRIPNNGTTSPPTIQQLLVAHTWKAQAVDVTYANSTTDHYVRGGGSNTVNYDSDSIRYNSDGTGVFYYTGVSYSTTWTWLNSQKTSLRLVIDYPTTVTVDQTNIALSLSQFSYTQVKTGDYTATVLRVPN